MPEEHASRAWGRDRARPAPTRPYRVAAPVCLNTAPVLFGLDESPEVRLFRQTPLAAGEMLASGEVDAALLASIDLQRLGEGLTVLPAGCAASAGPMLGVRVFSRVPQDELTVLWADAGATCATALAEVLWATNYDTRLCVIPFDPRRAWEPEDAEAVLLIGDKVVADPPIGFDWQWDLSAMWFELTGLPFVYAAWAATDPACCPDLDRILARAARRGWENLEAIAVQRAGEFGWPADLAVRCLTREMHYEMTPACREGLEDFFQYAADCEVIPTIHPLSYFEP